MSLVTALILVVGLPLLLVCGGFFFLMLHLFRGRDKSAQHDQTLAAARQLERSLAGIENRLSALEDIILAPGEKETVHER